ncbi:helix-turn-helix domain-containing protein [Actinomadura rubrisoli]|uniref:helix-turn-helix domain-containing protein n=1 Tax=Actinomadura rubrisoli TaxID=2530368 RepID=UPI001404BA76|nr:helix-turn-helix transcriptional regulator [Actinomadura rubrisoli]
MPDENPAEDQKKAFAQRLKEVRLDAGLTGVELADRCGWKNYKVSKIEHGAQRPSEGDIRKWAAACGIEGQVIELIAANREITAMWTDYVRELKPGMKAIQLRSLKRYQDCELIRVYESLFIPGFLQTLAVAKAQFTIHAKLHGLPLDDVDQAAENRMVRKKFLGTGKPMFVFLLEASVLYDNIGGPEVMSEQFDHLIEMSILPYVSIGIIPLGRIRTLYPGEGFYLFDEKLVHQEFWSGVFRTSRPDNIAYFVRAFEALRAQAVFGEAARAEIEKARRRLRAT